MESVLQYEIEQGCMGLDGMERMEDDEGKRKREKGKTRSERR